MKVESVVKEISERYAAIEVSIMLEQKEVSVVGFALASESGRFVELAQARAIALARRILAEGLDAVDPADYLSSDASPVLVTPPAHAPSPTAVPPPPPNPTKTAESPVSQPTAVPDTSDTQVEEALPDATDLPEVPW